MSAEPPNAGALDESANAAAAPRLEAAVEAVLMVADQPIDELTLAQAVGSPVDAVRNALSRLVERYREAGHGFELRYLAGGWRYYAREEYADVVERFVLDDQQVRLTTAALETLAVVAYRQPVSRGRVSAVRGVSVDAVMRTLVTRGLVQEAGSDPSTGAVLYGTTAQFLERMGLADLDELPDLAPYLPELDEIREHWDGGEGTGASAPGPGETGGSLS